MMADIDLDLQDILELPSNAVDRAMATHFNDVQPQDQAEIQPPPLETDDTASEHHDTPSPDSPDTDAAYVEPY
jgi:hypothetical protein